MEAVGDAVTGGLIARSVEPEAGEGRAGEGGVCLNCRTVLVGPHCHQCGQAEHIHRTVGAWWHDLAHGVLHLDGKIWRTLPLLAWRPGELTRRYVRGERAKFVSPLAIFLFSVFLMFAFFSALGITALGVDNVDDSRRDLSAELVGAGGKIHALEARRDAEARAGKATGALDRQIANEKSQLETMSALVSKGGTMHKPDIHTGWTRLDHGIAKASANPALLFYKLQSSAYKYSWALIPISLPFVWLLFLHRRRYRREYKAYDHLVFVTYSIAFMSLFLIAFVLLREIGLRGGVFNLAFILVPPLHMYRQLRGAYCLSRFSAAWCAAALLVCSGVAMTLFALLLLGLGLLG